MNRIIYVIGTDHRYQYLSDEFKDRDHQKFRELIENTISDKNISLISEECNLEALEEKGVTESVLQSISNETGLRHIFTEASLSYRNTNGMEQDNGIRASAFLEGISEEETEYRIQAAYRARERHWLNLINNENTWPVLHICGANHSAMFFQLIIDEGIDAFLLHKDWSN